MGHDIRGFEELCVLIESEVRAMELNWAKALFYSLSIIYYKTSSKYNNIKIICNNVSYIKYLIIKYLQFTILSSRCSHLSPLSLSLTPRVFPWPTQKLSLHNNRIAGVKATAKTPTSSMRHEWKNPSSLALSLSHSRQNKTKTRRVQSESESTSRKKRSLALSSKDRQRRTRTRPRSASFSLSAFAKERDRESRAREGQCRHDDDDNYDDDDSGSGAQSLWQRGWQARARGVGAHPWPRLRHVAADVISLSLPFTLSLSLSLSHPRSLSLARERQS